MPELLARYAALRQPSVSAVREESKPIGAPPLTALPPSLLESAATGPREAAPRQPSPQKSEEAAAEGIIMPVRHLAPMPMSKPTPIMPKAELRPPRTLSLSLPNSQDEELRRLRTRAAEQDAEVRALRAGMESLRVESAERDDELSAALGALHEARTQCARRDGEGAKWRAEHSRVVGRLDALAAHAEQQQELLLEKDAELEHLHALLNAGRIDPMSKIMGPTSGGRAAMT